MLLKQLENCFLHELGPKKKPVSSETCNLLGGIVPHASYIFSGPSAAHFYELLARAKKTKTIILIGPNHTGRGPPISIYPDGKWLSPLGSIEIDAKLAKEIRKKSDAISLERTAHQYEHSLEVQLPFLQYIMNDFKIVPVCMMFHDIHSCDELAYSIVETVEDLKCDVLVLATSDFSHYVPARQAQVIDRLIIDLIIKLDEERVLKLIERKKATICGYAPIVTLMVIAKELGYTDVKLLNYYTSGAILNDYSKVVGYATLAFMQPPKKSKK
jgi:hypothetical protein